MAHGNFARRRQFAMQLGGDNGSDGKHGSS
jgi:hypothetical protein